MKRRKFIYNAIGGAAALTLLPSLKFSDQKNKITILHTNDTHSRIDPFPSNDSKYPGLGGVNKRIELIEEIRKNEEHVLLLDAGDIFQGTPYFNMYGGEVEFKVMSAMGYDAATIGNHDFDGGLDGLVKVLPLANFPFLSANYDFSNTVLANKIEAYKIFQKGNYKIGVFGIGIELDGLVSKALYGDTIYLDPIKHAQQTASLLKNELGCDLVICLSHLGYHTKQNEMCDTILAKETEHINLIIGGHTHTFLDKAEEHKNKAGKKVLINQVGWSGLVLGRVDFYFDKEGNPELWALNSAASNLVVG